MKTAAMLLAVLTGTALALVSAYHVDPIRADWSGKADPEDGVSEVLTVAFDSLSGGHVEGFFGDRGSPDYRLQLFTYPGGSPVSQPPVAGIYVQDNDWVRFEDIPVTYPESIVKGKRLEFRFTRTGDDSIQFYWDAFAGTKYDSMIVPGGNFQPPPEPARPALCCRIFGQMNPIDSTYWGFSIGDPDSIHHWPTVGPEVKSAGVMLDRFDFNWNSLEHDGPGMFVFGPTDDRADSHAKYMGFRGHIT